MKITKAKIRNRLALFVSALLPRRVCWFVIVKAMDRVCQSRDCFPGQIAWYEPIQALDVKNPVMEIADFVKTS